MTAADGSMHNSGRMANDETIVANPADTFDRPWWAGETCGECGEPFNELSWDLRHSRLSDGADVHEACCPDCAAEGK